MKTPRLDKLTQKWLANKPFVAGQIIPFSVMHDDWCRFLKGKGDCNCNPDFVLGIVPSTPGDIHEFRIVPAPPASHN